MTNFSVHPWTVDGERLDTLAWGVEAHRRTAGGLVPGDVPLPGLDGTVPSFYDAREPGNITLSMYVLGTDANGVVPGGEDAQERVRRNLDDLLQLFGQTHRLIDVRELVKAGEERQFLAKVTDKLEPEIRAGGLGRLVVSCQVPGSYGRDTATADWTQTAVVSGTVYDVTTLTGSSAPVNDAIVLLKGPFATGVTIYDQASGQWVRLNTLASSTQAWRLNSGTWSTRHTTNLLISDPDTAGIDRAGITDTTGIHPYLLRLTPSRSGGVRKVQVRVVGTGFTSGTALTVRARRAYL